MNHIEALEEKFLVINKKHFIALNAKHFGNFFDQHPSVVALELALCEFSKAYDAEIGRPLDQRYIVCNQDEPYAEEVARIILEGEMKKAEGREKT